MKKVFVVIENLEGFDEMVKVFAKKEKAEAFAFNHQELRYCDGDDVEVAVVEMEVQ